MNYLKKSFLVITPLILSACANQNTIAQKKLTPVTSPCQKISMLIKAHENGFEQVKMTKIKARISNTWKAKYNIIGDNCHVWSWGSSETTYACNITASDKETAENYYNNAKQTIQQCLGNDWLMTEEPRKSDKGRKSTFTKSSKQVSLSAHIVPIESTFTDKWNIYYYIGNPN